ncbi:DUF4157 domain-containing protein [Streptomyces sp. NPDC047803]|uniref:eCIS core domain-containing protein n=1 Tax=unclassified Streptomyces TaxID=2593676 RepID=UPI0033DEA1B8
MHAEERAMPAEARKGRAPARQPRAASPTPPPGPLALQSTVGNAAVVQMLRRAGHPGAQERHQHNADCIHQQTDHPVQRSAVDELLRTPGNALDAATRFEMEARLGADFSDVRISDGRSSFKSLSVQPGIVWLQECAAHKQLTVSNADILTHIRKKCPENLITLRIAGLVT